MIFGPPCHPPRGTHISASRALIKNRLDESSNLAQRGIHAKFQPNSTSRLARAMGGGSIFDFSSYNWRMSVYIDVLPSFYLSIILFCLVFCFLLEKDSRDRGHVERGAEQFPAFRKKTWKKEKLGRTEADGG